MTENQLTRLDRYRPGPYGAMVQTEDGAYVRAADVEAVLRELEPHLIDKLRIAQALVLIERLR